MKRIDLSQASSRYRCKCGQVIYVFDAEKTIAHPAPDCEWFTNFLKAGIPPDQSGLAVAV